MSNVETIQDPPFAVQLELVEGCTLACDFCGVNGIRDMPGGFKFMNGSTMIRIGDELQKLQEYGWNPRIEFAMHGEPSVHPDLLVMVSVIRRAVGDKTSIVMFSNGSGFRRVSMNDVLEAGVNTIGLDNYEHVKIVPNVLAKYDGKYPVYNYPEQPEHNLHTGRRVGRRDIVVIQDISSASNGNHSDLNTHCGAGMPGKSVQRRCAKPFRELSIRWDGNVALCCNDFRGEYKVANVNEVGLYAIWNSPRMQAARRYLYNGDRSLSPCDKCNAKSTRVGLLPDAKGLETLPPPTDDDRKMVESAVRGAPYSPVVLRRWEWEGKPMDTPAAEINKMDARREGGQ